ncbi:hypothetical protein VTL71DRAFT_9467 [Oculimacula yallundae]|uniref:Uncharacterized protein n=1 Tax=Oculimacula yallundae TaxID=86028 RepID=A0ABR4BTK5_9HELO
MPIRSNLTPRTMATPTPGTPSSSRPPPPPTPPPRLQTFQFLLFALESSPEFLLKSYQTNVEIATKAYNSLADYHANTVLSDLAHEEGRWADYAKWRLVKLGKYSSYKNVNAIGRLIYREMHAAGVWDNVDVDVDVGGFDVDVKNNEDREFLQSLKDWYKDHEPPIEASALKLKEEPRELRDTRMPWRRKAKEGGRRGGGGDGEKEVEGGRGGGGEKWEKRRWKEEEEEEGEENWENWEEKEEEEEREMTANRGKERKKKAKAVVNATPGPSLPRPTTTATNVIPTPPRGLHTWHQIESHLRLPIKLFLQALFYIMVTYFLIYCLLFLLKQIPIIGPAIVFLINQINDLIPTEPSTPHGASMTWLLDYNISTNAFIRKIIYPVVSTFVRSEAEVEELPVAPISHLFAVIENTQNLSQISMQLLPVAKLLEYSSYSLISASAVVGASDLQGKKQLAEEYTFLLEHTRTLGVSLRKFDIGVEMLMKNFSLHLSMTLERIREIVVESNTKRANPWWEFFTHATTLTSSTCSLLPVLKSLDLIHSNPFIWATCGVSLLLSTQGHCYLLSKAENSPSTFPSTAADPLLHTVCTPTRYFNPTSISSALKEQLHEEAQMLADEFTNLVSAASNHIEYLLQHSQNSSDDAQIIQNHYQIVQVLRKTDENAVLYKQKTLTIKAQPTPASWLDWFRNQHAADAVKASEQFAGVRLTLQWRDLKELESIQHDADFFLKSAIEVLHTMQANLGAFGRDVGFFEQYQLQHNAWQALVKQMERLEPIVEKMDGLRGAYSKERKKVAGKWRERWDFCVKQRKKVQLAAVEIGKGWEDCLFRTE